MCWRAKRIMRGALKDCSKRMLSTKQEEGFLAALFTLNSIFYAVFLEFWLILHRILHRSYSSTQHNTSCKKALCSTARTPEGEVCPRPIPYDRNSKCLLYANDIKLFEECNNQRDTNLLQLERWTRGVE